MRSQFLALLALGACTLHHQNGPDETTGLALSAITVDLSAQSYEDGKVGVFGTPYTTSAAMLALGGGDRMDASVAGGASTVLVGDNTHYSATLATSAAPPFDVVISFVRTSPPAEARSTVALPAPPRVTAAPTTLTQGEDLVIDLAVPPPTGAHVRLRFIDVISHGTTSPSCLELPDPIVDPTHLVGTRITLASATLFARDPKKSDVPARECNMNIGVRFETTGTRAPELGGGSFSGLMERPAYASGSLHVTRTDV
jgi:hypothetical protein